VTDLCAQIRQLQGELSEARRQINSLEIKLAVVLGPSGLSTDQFLVAPASKSTDEILASLSASLSAGHKAPETKATRDTPLEDVVSVHYSGEVPLGSRDFLDRARDYLATEFSRTIRHAESQAKSECSLVERDGDYQLTAGARVHVNWRLPLIQRYVIEPIEKMWIGRGCVVTRDYDWPRVTWALRLGVSPEGRPSSATVTVPFYRSSDRDN